MTTAIPRDCHCGATAPYAVHLDSPNLTDWYVICQSCGRYSRSASVGEDLYTLGDAWKAAVEIWNGTP